jgi:hypothetical protein
MKRDANDILREHGTEELRRVIAETPAEPERPNGGGRQKPPRWNEAPPIGEKVRPNFRSLADFCAEFRPRFSSSWRSRLRPGSAKN